MIYKRKVIEVVKYIRSHMQEIKIMYKGSKKEEKKDRLYNIDKKKYFMLLLWEQ